MIPFRQVSRLPYFACLFVLVACATQWGKQQTSAGFAAPATPGGPTFQDPEWFASGHALQRLEAYIKDQATRRYPIERNPFGFPPETQTEGNLTPMITREMTRDRPTMLRTESRYPNFGQISYRLPTPQPEGTRERESALDEDEEETLDDPAASNYIQTPPTTLSSTMEGAYTKADLHSAVNKRLTSVLADYGLVDPTIVFDVSSLHQRLSRAIGRVREIVLSFGMAADSEIASEMRQLDMKERDLLHLCMRQSLTLKKEYAELAEDTVVLLNIVLELLHIHLYDALRFSYASAFLGADGLKKATAEVQAILRANFDHDNQPDRRVFPRGLYKISWKMFGRPEFKVNPKAVSDWLAHSILRRERNAFGRMLMFWEYRQRLNRTVEEQQFDAIANF